MNIVIGSGPAGVACTYALLEKGKDVLVVDAGIELEQQQRDLLTRLSIGENPDALSELTAMQSQMVSSHGVDTKLTYGSDFPYRDARENLDLETSGTGLVPSLAMGGLSNVWGAAALPYLQRDISDWPIKAEDLAIYYEKVVKITGLSARKDDLAELLPLHTESPNYLEASSQAKRLMESLEPIRASLKKDGIRYGSSRLMVGPSLSSKQPCVYCGQCIYGCPYSCIYNSGDDLKRLLKERPSGLRYQSNLIVTTIKEKGDEVTVNGFDRLSKEAVSLKAERAFLAAGVIPSSRIILKSREAYDKTLEVKDSQYFLFPLLSIKGDKDAVKESAYTLSQLFFEIDDAEISPHTVHLQFYMYNDIISKTLEKKLWFLPLFRQLLIRQLEHRIIIVQGYLHSRHSGRMRLNLSHDSATRKDHLEVEGVPNPEARGLIGKIIKKIGKHFVKLGILPIAPALELCLPGRGFHSGGSFPMRSQPGSFESDIYGRVGGAARIHVVDGSIFPSIPATTITFTAMANAYRIGSQDY